MTKLNKIKSKALEVLNSQGRKALRWHIEYIILFDDFLVLGNSYLPKKDRSPYAVYCDTAGYINATDFIIDNLIKQNNAKTTKI